MLLKVFKKYPLVILATNPTIRTRQRLQFLV